MTLGLMGRGGARPSRLLGEADGGFLEEDDARRRRHPQEDVAADEGIAPATFEEA